MGSFPPNVVSHFLIFSFSDDSPVIIGLFFCKDPPTIPPVVGLVTPLSGSADVSDGKFALILLHSTSHVNIFVLFLFPFLYFQFRHPLKLICLLKKTYPPRPVDYSLMY